MAILTLRRGWVLALLVCAVLGSSQASGKIIYVDAAATGSNSGTSWPNAYRFLQNALISAVSGDQIWVAKGVYKPDKGAGIMPGDRHATFQLKNGVSIFGGFPSGGGNWESRDPTPHETILSGDLSGNDIEVVSLELLPAEPSRADNSLRIVTGSGTNETAVLDGFVISGGNANKEEYPMHYDYGAGIHNEWGRPTITNCTFVGNSAVVGGGMYNYGSSPKVTNCIFRENSGGGMFNWASSPTVTNCTFISNWSESVGGGMENYGGSNSQVTKCMFSGNSASNGGGMSNYESAPNVTSCTFFENVAHAGGGMSNFDANPKVINCAFLANSAVESYAGGGGMYSTGQSNIGSKLYLFGCFFSGNSAHTGGALWYGMDSSSTVVNCTFFGNSSWDSGGVIGFNHGGYLTMHNCILWNNKPDQMPQGYNALTITHSNVQGGWTGTGNIDIDPLFIDADGPDNVTGTEDDNLRLLAGSPCLDTGDNSEIPPSITTDPDDNPRIVDGSVDMGAYEGHHQGFRVSADSIRVPEGETATFTVALSDDPAGIVEVSIAVESDDPDIIVESGGLLVFNSSNWSQSETITLAARQDEDHSGGKTLLGISAPGFVKRWVTAKEADNDPYADIIFVDADAPGANNGSSWENAFTNLQQALSAARADRDIRELWLAQGMYRPTGPFGDRAATFGLINGVAIRGGYAGFGEDNPDARDVHVYKTILSGDLAGNDAEIFDPSELLNEPTRAENSYHVVTAFRIDNTAILDGLTITGGNANVFSEDAYNGGGIYSYYSSPTLIDCTLMANSAQTGGGMLNFNGDPTLIHCAFTRNAAFRISYYSGAGGGICSSGNPTFTNCTFTANSTDGTGGAMVGGGTLTNCVFEGNSAAVAGGICGGGIITSCTFSENRAESGGGGIQAGGDLYLEDCTIQDNSPCGISIDSSIVHIRGIIQLICNDWNVEDSRIEGDGTILLHWFTGIEVDNDDYDSSIACTIAGPGTLFSYNDLIVENNATIDLGYEVDPNGQYVAAGIPLISCQPLPITPEFGEIVCGYFLSLTDNAQIRNALISVGSGCELVIEGQARIEASEIWSDGLLRARGNAQITNANIKVTRASFEGDVNICNSVIEAEAGAPYGQFYIEDSVTISNNEIHADGDRYMDLDPSVFVGLIENNRIFVTITEGVGQTRGGLFELRGKPDLAGSIACDPVNPFFCSVSAVPDFNPGSWMIEELRLVDGAKANLTNRFDLQPPFDSGGQDEVLYVRNLILGKDAVLNTSFNHIYYQNLQSDPSSIVKNEPLLGFSLSNIAFDDEIEFLTRVKHNNYIDPDDPDENRIHVERLTDLVPDPNGMMRMCNLEGYNACAQGLFARANEETIMIRFEYLFETADPGIELIVYLTDAPELIDHDAPDRNEHYIEVGRLRPPPEGRPGSAGSGRFGVLLGYARRGNLDFLRGTRIELELMGPAGTSILINNWDPQVHCNPLYCGDITGDWGATQLDYLTVLAHIGCRSELPHDGGPSLVCMDMGFGADGYVDAVDSQAWDWRLNLPDPHFCELPLVPSGTAYGTMECSVSNELETPPGPISVYPPEGMLISGKRAGSRLEDCHYLFDSEGGYIAGVSPAFSRANGKLIKDSGGQLYQINLSQGLVRLSDGKSVVPPGTTAIPFMDPRYGLTAEVRIGLGYQDYEWSGCPILDAAFDPDGVHLYIAPVVVVPEGQAPYQAVAKVRPFASGNPAYEVVQLYDDPPLPGDNQSRDNLRDIELDNAHNLYVTNVGNLNESDTIWVFDTDTGNVENRRCLGREDSDSYVPAPTALHISNRGFLYLASALQPSDSNSVSVHVLSADDLSPVAEIMIRNMGHVTAIAEDPSTGTVWVAGFTMTEIPEYINPLGEPFYKPYLAKIPLGPVSPIEAECLSDPVMHPDNDLALPLSLVSLSGGGLDCSRANIDGVGKIDLLDLERLSMYWMDIDCGTCDGAELTDDGGVDIRDLLVFSACWLYENP